MIIADKNILTDEVFIIAELSANHGGKIENAIASIRAAKKTGANAIKLQSYTPDTITLDVDNDYFKVNHGTIWDGQKLYNLYQQAYTPFEWHEELFRVAREEGIICFSSPFDKTAVDLLESLDTPAYKIASFEITDIPLIKYVASKGKPMILSTGIANLSDIELALKTCREAGNNDIALLKCTSQYPANPADANLLTIKNLADTFGVVSGISDHTEGPEACIMSVALGGRIIEKHFILDKSIGGPDASFSIDLEAFQSLVQSVRKAEQMLGKVSYESSSSVKKSRTLASRSLFAVADIRQGETLTEQNIRSIRPGYGLHPKHFFDILGKEAKEDIKRGTPLNFDLFE
ncbi:MAG: pseudaminic acid synthase [Flavobacteriales bacterium]|nr:pseudaminic acid synthase [Flavobacteriales bacterium]